MINLDQTLNSELFEKALINNRPVFIDYFLRKQYNILQTSDFIKLKNDPNKEIIQTLNTKFNSPSSNNNQENDSENENQLSTIDGLHRYQLEEDDVNVRAAFARKFLIEKLYKNKLDHLEVISIYFIEIFLFFHF